MIFGSLYTDWTLAVVVQTLVRFPSDGTRLAQMLWVGCLFYWQEIKSADVVGMD